MNLLRRLVLGTALALGVGFTSAAGSVANYVVVGHVSSNVQKITVGDAVAVAAGGGWAEITTAAFGPGENSQCPAGRLVFGAGNRIVVTDLAGTLVTLPGGANNPWTAPLVETYTPHIVYDNHLVKLPTGELVYTFEGVTWNDNISPHPSWWYETVTYPLKNQSHPGGRGNVYVFTSTDCGSHWSHISDIDAAKLYVPAGTSTDAGLCGWPRLINDNGTKHSEAGGWDGHFLYADPYSGKLFLATPCVYGNGTENWEQSRALLLASSDKGYHWTVIGQQLWAWLWRQPIGSIKTGQVGFAFVDPATITLRLATFPNTAGNVDLSAAASLKTFPSGSLPSGVQTGSSMVAYATLAGNNITPPRWYLAWPFFQGSNKLVAGLYNMTAGSVTQTGNLVEPAYSGGAVFYGSLVDGPPNSTLALFYWTDVNPTQPNNTYTKRFQVLSHGEPLLASPALLSLNNGTPYSWQYQNGVFAGDYDMGASYRFPDGSTGFVGTWSENGTLHYNTVVLSRPDERPWLANWGRDGFQQQANELIALGERPIDISSLVLPGDELRYNMVFASTPEARQWVGGWTQGDLVARNTLLQGQGYRMLKLSGAVLSGDQVRYNAVWKQTNESYPWAGGWTMADLLTKDTQLRSQGYQLVNISAFVLSGDQARYNGIWKQTNALQHQVLGWTLADLLTYNGQISNQGYRLVDASALVLSGDQVRYNAIWRKQANPTQWVLGWAPADVWNINQTLANQGYRIMELNSVVLSGGQVRYNVVWELPECFRCQFLPLIRK